MEPERLANCPYPEPDQTSMSLIPLHPLAADVPIEIINSLTRPSFLVP